ncbi:MAG TPA: ammonium transporter [Chromatiaceae bacterium]|jgi:hypothetical protein|nr:ammonium transporter [Chromatiaceae bacterium]HIA08853.1 ammonium transporter [Chromatiaceae bacterium]HIN81900.1 ammonium transporter [Chromatiales bacterium]HIO14724.1 ammonium transporter [Chromatiales bacterium]HIO54921.1 ammonium transporter [Chromatiales bacterium]
MNRRLYFLLPDVETSRQVVDELLLARIEERHIHALAKDGTQMEDLPEAGLLEKSDFVHGIEQGLAVGGVTGMLAGLVAITFPPAGLILGGGAVLATTFAGAGVGAWVSGMVATDIPNSRLTEFESQVKAGDILMMVDVPKDRVDDISSLVKKHHPEADMHGTEPTIPAFP